MTTWSNASMTGFEGTEFRILWDGGDDSTNMPGWSQQSYVVENHIAGSNTTEIDAMGLGPFRRSFRLMTQDKFRMAALRLLQQTSGRLRIPAAMSDLVDADVIEELFAGILYATIDNVLLESLSEFQINVNGECYAVAVFVKEPADG
jgi:hypothetical protein